MSTPTPEQTLDKLKQLTVARAVNGFDMCWLDNSLRREAIATIEQLTAEILIAKKCANQYAEGEAWATGDYDGRFRDQWIPYPQIER